MFMADDVCDPFLLIISLFTVGELGFKSLIFGALPSATPLRSYRVEEEVTRVTDVLHCYVFAV